MKALTLTQPWAQLVAIGAKRIETRSWRTRAQNVPIAIHAAATLPVAARRALHSRPFEQALGAANLPNYDIHPAGLPYGAIIAVCTLVQCDRIPELAHTHIFEYGADSWIVPPRDKEYQFGDYRPGRWAWLLSNPRALRKPIPAAGALSLWEWDAPADLESLFVEVHP